MDDVIAEVRRQIAAGAKIGEFQYLQDFVEPHPGVNERDASGFTLLHHACRSNLPGLAALLLRVPGIEVNCTVEDYTPLMMAAVMDHFVCVRLLLLDARIDITLSRVDETFEYSIAAFEYAALMSSVESVKWFLALRTRAENTTRFYPGKPPMGALLHAYHDAPDAVRQRVCLELGILTPASLFALFVLVSDDFLRPRDHDPLYDAARRFLMMAARLPLELQMVLASRILNSPRDVILSKEINPAVDALLAIFTERAQ